MRNSRFFSLLAAEIALIATLAVACAPSSAPIVYRPGHYGFTFTLPSSWRGYTIVMDEWQGFVPGPQGDTVVQTGPLILIRHPSWTEQNPRQDIPIMVFFHSQWDAVKQGSLMVSAAPVPPTELGHNDTYVFALPARYNYAFLPGWEEVEKILAGNPLKTP